MKLQLKWHWLWRVPGKARKKRLPIKFLGKTHQGLNHLLKLKCVINVYAAGMGGREKQRKKNLSMLILCECSFSVTANRPVLQDKAHIGENCSPEQHFFLIPLEGGCSLEERGFGWLNSAWLGKGHNGSASFNLSPNQGGGAARIGSWYFRKYLAWGWMQVFLLYNSCSMVRRCYKY